MSDTVAAQTGESPSILETPVKRRRGLQWALSIIGGIAADQVAGGVVAMNMGPNPTATVFANPNTNNVMISFPGTRNDGAYLGNLLQPHFRESNYISIRYSGNNVEPGRLTNLIAQILSDLQMPSKDDLQLGYYDLSAGGNISLPVMQQVGIPPRVVMLDSAPRDRADLRGFNGVMSGTHIDSVFGRSRLLSEVLKIISDIQIPDAAKDRAEGVSLYDAYAYRYSTVHADGITMSAETAAIRDTPRQPGLWRFARDVVYLHCNGTDPLVISETAIAKYLDEFGTIEDYADPHRSSDSHGVGPLYPGGVRNRFEHYMLGQHE